MWRALRRRQALVFAAAVVCVVVPSALRHGVTSPMWLTGVALLALWLILLMTGRPDSARPLDAAVLIAPPMSGRWRGLNSPAGKVPSHGTHQFGQTYAIDVLYEPRGLPKEHRRRLHLLWPQTLRPRSYPSFGQPLFAPADGVVVRAGDGQRDHLGRMSTLGLIYLFFEGVARMMGGHRLVFGNHVIMRLESEEVAVDGERAVYAVLAHLRRGSLTVGPGDRVYSGQKVAECGNSGNSSDPHLHFHLMDDADPALGKGVPFRWRYRDEDGRSHVGVPGNGELFHVDLSPGSGSAGVDPAPPAVT